jgi:hypothetical protein
VRPSIAAIERLSTHPNRFRWPERLLRLLGKLPDREIAERAGVHPGTVANERRRRKIPAYSPHRPVEWTQERIALLGTASDRDVAAALGIGHRSVFHKRRVLGIPPFKEPVREEMASFHWTPQALALLGKASDRAVARRLGISATTVFHKRLALGIPSYKPPPKRITWTAEMLGRLGRVPDVEIAACFGIGKDSVAFKREELGIPPAEHVGHPIRRSPELVELLKLPNPVLRKRYGISKATALKLRREFGLRTPDSRNLRWTPERRAKLGKVPDAELAKEMGITPGAVSDKRRRLGIPPRVPYRAPWTAEEIALLGTLSDQEVAARIGKSREAVKAKRRALGVPPAPRK